MLRWLAATAAIAAALPACDHESEYAAAANALIRSDKCEEHARCNGIVLVVCYVPEGPSYYFDEDTVEVISACGGACVFETDEAQREVCATLCPPPAWTCEP